MYSTTARTIPCDPTTRSEHLGILVTRSGLATLDQYFTTDSGTTPELAKFLVVGTTGNIVYQYYDGTYGAITNAIPGFWYPVAAVRVVTSYTFNQGGALSTTASIIRWYGGA